MLPAVCALLLLATAATTSAASIDSNLVYETPRIASGDALVSQVINDCFAADTMSCLKGKVLNYLDTQLNINEEYGRSAAEGNKIDEVIYDRAARVLQQQSFRVQLPETLFDRAELSYSPEAGLDVTPAAEEGRGHLLKKKILLPILLLLKLKFKALLPIFVALIGVKALKALILSKLAITLVLGFVIYNLIAKKTAAMPMTESPATAYGPPTSASASSSYDSSAWEASSSGGPYARVWEPSTSGSAQSLAYSSYYPSSSSSGSGSASGSSSASLTSSSSSGSSSSY